MSLAAGRSGPGLTRLRPLEVIVVAQTGRMLAAGSFAHPLEQTVRGRADALDQGSAGLGGDCGVGKRLGSHGWVSRLLHEDANRVPEI